MEKRHNGQKVDNRRRRKDEPRFDRRYMTDNAPQSKGTLQKEVMLVLIDYGFRAIAVNPQTKQILHQKNKCNDI